MRSHATTEASYGSSPSARSSRAHTSSRRSRLYLPYISPISRLYLAYISPAQVTLAKELLRLNCALTRVADGMRRHISLVRLLI